jgi:hypothetical protein
VLAFIILFLLAYVALWFLLSGTYKILGKFINRIVNDSVDAMTTEEERKGDL